MTIELFLLSWVISGGVLGVIVFYIEETATTLGDLILMVVSFMIFGWISVLTALFYYTGVGFCWLCDRKVFQIELKKREK